MMLKSREFYCFALVWLVFWLCAYNGYAGGL